MKSRVFVSHYQSFDSQMEDFRHPVQSPFARRFSSLQRAMIEVFERLRNQSPVHFQLILKELESPLYFATSLGEIDSVTKVIGSVLKKDLPVSPMAFQHSVHNAPAGHVSIHYGLRSPQLTFSSGYLSLDKALFSAYHKVSKNQMKAVCVVAGEEFLNADKKFFARTEICFLTQEKMMGVENFEIENFECAKAPLSLAANFEKISFSGSEENLETARLNLNKMPAAFVREVVDFDQEALHSRWQKIL